MLVVDDDPLILMDACDILSDAGFQPIETDNGDTARPMLVQHGDKITLLFTDVEMPGSTNGFELARWVAERWPAIEIVVASGRVRPADDDMPHGASFIPKPFSSQLIHDHLREKLPDHKKPDPLKSFNSRRIAAGRDILSTGWRLIQLFSASSSSSPSFSSSPFGPIARRSRPFRMLAITAMATPPSYPRLLG